ncbi:aldose epimerase family protein [Bacteroides sp.]
MEVIHQIATYTRAGEPVYRFRVVNRSGAYVELTNWGARWITAMVPDAEGQRVNVLRGYDNLDGYLSDTYYMGAIIGRFANRIAGASFFMDGVTYHLEANDNLHTNHGGFSGFHQKLWQWEKLPDGVRFTLISPDGEGGYPGTVRVSVDYRWNEQNELSVRYRGRTDRSTYLNMTNHAYFNLSGTGREITSHYLSIPAQWMLDTTSEFIPTGEKVPVAGTPFDFTAGKPIGQDIHADNEQLLWNRGYNHCYVLKENTDVCLLQAACLRDPDTGRQLAVWTDLPGVLLYTAGYYEYPHTAVCLETQFFPDTPSHPHFPSCLLRPGEEYDRRTIYQFT